MFVIMFAGYLLRWDKPRFPDERQPGILRHQNVQSAPLTIFDKAITAHSAVKITVKMNPELWGSETNFEILSLEEYEQRTGKHINPREYRHV